MAGAAGSYRWAQKSDLRRRGGAGMSGVRIADRARLLEQVLCSFQALV